MGKPAIVLRTFDDHLTGPGITAGRRPRALPESEILYCPARANPHGAGCYTWRFAERPTDKGACAMYRKGSVIEIQFPPERLNDAAGDPYWIDLTLDEARRLYEQLAARFATDARANQPLDTFSID